MYGRCERNTPTLKAIAGIVTVVFAGILGTLSYQGKPAPWVVAVFAVALVVTLLS